MRDYTAHIEWTVTYTATVEVKGRTQDEAWQEAQNLAESGEMDPDGSECESVVHATVRSLVPALPRKPPTLTSRQSR